MWEGKRGRNDQLNCRECRRSAQHSHRSLVLNFEWKCACESQNVLAAGFLATSFLLLVSPCCPQQNEFPSTLTRSDYKFSDSPDMIRANDTPKRKLRSKINFNLILSIALTIPSPLCYWTECSSCQSETIQNAKKSNSPTKLFSLMFSFEVCVLRLETDSHHFDFRIQTVLSRSRVPRLKTGSVLFLCLMLSMPQLACGRPFSPRNMTVNYWNSRYTFGIPHNVASVGEVETKTKSKLTSYYHTFKSSWLCRSKQWAYS